MAPLKKNLRPVAAALGRRIAALRTAAGLTQAELAVRVKSSSAVLSRVERGMELSSIERLVAIAKALGFELRDLFDGVTATDDRREAAIAEIAAMLRRQPVKEVERVVEVVRALVK